MSVAARRDDERVRNCCWFKPEYNEKGQVVISRTLRMKYAIQGGLPDSIVKDDMEMVVGETTKEVKKQIDRLSKYTHITKEVFYSKDDIEALAEEPLKAVESLLVSIEDAKERFNELMIGTVDNEIFNIFLYRTIDEIDSLATHHNIDVYNLGETKVVDIDDECIYFHASGTVIVHLQFGLNADLRNDMGHEMDVAYPFDAVFASSIPQDLDGIMLSVVNFEVDTDEDFDLEKEIEAFLKEKRIS